MDQDAIWGAVSVGTEKVFLMGVKIPNGKQQIFEETGWWIVTYRENTAPAKRPVPTRNAWQSIASSLPDQAVSPPCKH